MQKPEQMKQIKLLLLDADGVLTDGRIIFNDDGTEIKAFNVKDGLGIRLLLDAGIKVAIVTARLSPALDFRCKNLGIEHVFSGIKDKAALLDKILTQLDADVQETAFMGDDLPDLAIMRKVGFAIAPADAIEIIRENADLVTRAKGGNGAVREACEGILKHLGLWENVLERFG